MIGLRKLSGYSGQSSRSAVWYRLHYCVVKVFKGLVTPSLLPLASSESTL